MKEFDIKRMTPAEQIAYIMTRIYRAGMTTLSGGNISIMDNSGDMWISPGGVDKGTLTAEDIVCVRADGTIQGKHRPSSEYPFHKAVFEMRPSMKAIIHAHPPALVAFSIVHQMPDTRISPEIYRICGEIGFAEYDLPGSEELGARIADEFRSKPQVNAVIMENHGTVLCGTDMQDAYVRFETLEYCARMILGSRALGEYTSLTPSQLHGKVGALPKSVASFDNTAAREQICSVAARAVKQELMCSAIGTISVRTSGNDFLITPYDGLRWDLCPEDIIAMKESESGNNLHAAIYKAYPEINALITASPVNIMSYAATARSFDVRTIPESWILLKDIPLMEFGTADYKILDELNQWPCIMVANQGVLVAGNNLMHAFDRLEVAELSARSLIMASPLGVLRPIGNDEIEALRIAFKVK